MDERDVIADDGSLAYAMEYAASRLKELRLNPDPDAPLQDAARAFFVADRKTLSEVAITCLTLVKRYYKESSPSDAQRKEWNA